MYSYLDLCGRPTNAPVKYVYNVLFITYTFQSLLQQSSGYIHENTDKIQQTAILQKQNHLML